MTVEPRQLGRSSTEGVGRGAVVAALVAFAAIALSASSAAAWKFDKACGAESKTQNLDTRQSQGYVMLDKSGSMGWGGKWSEATKAVKNAVSANTYPNKKDVIQFGLGLYSNSARNEVSPQEDAYPPIENAVDSASPGGGTNMTDGIKTSMNVLQNEPNADKRPQAGMVVTDGKPNGASKRKLINTACKHQKDAGSLYAIGLGTGTDEEMNDTVAAAGGTGYCCDNGGDCGPNSSSRVDPCNTNPYNCQTKCNGWGWCYTSCSRRSNWECHGGRQTSGGTGLKNIISKISNELACRVKVDDVWKKKWSDQAYGCASDDYNCMKLTHDGLSIDYKPNQPTRSGWRWANPQQQDRVVLNEDTCNKVRKNYTSDTVTVDRACMCKGGTPGTTCTVQNPKTCQCTEGRVVCQQSFTQCKPKTNCPQNQRKGYGGSCTVGKGVCQKQGTQFCPQVGQSACGKKTSSSSSTVLGEAGRKQRCAGQAWKSVTLTNQYYPSNKPLVFATTQTTNGAQDPSAAHVARVNRAGFYTQHCELDTFLGSSRCDGHSPETNGWLALNPKRVNNAKGMAAGTYRTDSKAEPHHLVHVHKKMKVNGKPLVFTQTQTENGSDPARNTQVIDIVSSDADTTIEYCEQQYRDDCASHNSETVAWFAVDPNAANIRGVDMGRFTTADSGWKRISFDQAFAKPPAVIAQVQTENGSDEALYPEVKNVTNTGAEVRYCESEGNDSCDKHASEVVAWIAVSQGKLSTRGSASWTTISPGSPTEDPEKVKICDGKDNDCDGRVDDLLGQRCDVEAPQNPDRTYKQGRCKVGEWACPNGKGSNKSRACRQRHRAIPEMCNGLDDDCDGTVDNIENSWNNNPWSVDTSNLSSQGEARVCGTTGACRCPNAGDRDDQYRAERQSTSDRQSEFDRAVQSTVQNDGTDCVCEE